MAKKVVAKQKSTESKEYIKCIKMVHSPKTGAYIFKELMLPPEKTQDFFDKN